VAAAAPGGAGAARGAAARRRAAVRAAGVLQGGLRAIDTLLSLHVHSCMRTASVMLLSTVLTSSAVKNPCICIRDYTNDQL